MKKEIFMANELLELEALEIHGGSAAGGIVQYECVNEARGCGAGVDQVRCVNKEDACAGWVPITQDCDTNNWCPSN